MQQGVVIKAYKGFNYVQIGATVYPCSARKKLKQSGQKILVGDKVVCQILPNTEEGVIEAILPRKNELLRPRIANVEQILITMAVKETTVNWLLLDRLLVQAGVNQIPAVICFNKIDLLTGEGFSVAEPYQAAGYPVFFTSAETGTGLAELKQVLVGKITVLAGLSGVGKSSLLNVLVPGLHLPTSAVSAKLQKGRHTTRHIELFALDSNSWVADSPGFSMLELPLVIKPEQLGSYYPDLLAWADKCRFDSCLHEAEPDCAVKAAVASGQLAAGRYERYLSLLQELRDRKIKY